MTNFPISATTTRMGRPPLNAKSATKPVLVRLTEAQAQRIDELAGPNKRAEFIRDAVDREIIRRTRQKP